MTSLPPKIALVSFSLTASACTAQLQHNAFAYARITHHQPQWNPHTCENAWHVSSLSLHVFSSALLGKSHSQAFATRVLWLGSWTWRYDGIFESTCVFFWWQRSLNMPLDWVFGTEYSSEPCGKLPRRAVKCLLTCFAKRWASRRGCFLSFLSEKISRSRLSISSISWFVRSTVQYYNYSASLLKDVGKFGIYTGTQSCLHRRTDER